MKRGEFRHRRSISAGHPNNPGRGFTLVELLLVVLIGITVAAIAVPMVNTLMTTYRLRAAVSSINGAIQTSRYLAIQNGYAYQVVLDKNASTLQVQSDPARSGSFANVGHAQPLAGSAIPVVLGANTTLQFRPSGLVSATVGSQTLTLTYGDKTETITVSAYGNVKVTP